MRGVDVVRAAPVVALSTIVAIAIAVRATRPARTAPVVTTAVASALPRAPAPALGADVPDAHTPRGARAFAMQHGDGRRTHRAEARGPGEAARRAWRADVGGPVVAQVTASPDGRTLYAATLGGALVALDRATGHVAFRVDLGGRAYGAPLVLADGTIVVGSDAKKLFAVSPEGAVKVRLELGDEVDTSPLLTSSGDVVVAAGTALVALRPSLDVRWRYRARGKIFTSPAELEGGIVVVGAQDHHVHAVDGAGKLAWKVDLGADVDGSPAVDDAGNVVVGTDGNEVVRLSKAGVPVARTRVGGFVRGPLSIARNGDAVVGTYGPAPRLVRVSPLGEVVFELPVQGTGAREHGVHGGPLEDAAGTLYFGAQDDRVRGIGRDGSLRLDLRTEGDVDAPLTLLEDGGLVIPCDDGTISLVLP